MKPFQRLIVIILVGCASAVQALAREGVPINTANQGAGKLNLLVGVPEDRYEDAIRVIYATIDDSL